MRLAVSTSWKCATTWLAGSRWKTGEATFPAGAIGLTYKHLCRVVMISISLRCLQQLQWLRRLLQRNKCLSFKCCQGIIDQRRYFWKIAGQAQCLARQAFCAGLHPAFHERERPEIHTHVGPMMSKVPKAFSKGIGKFPAFYCITRQLSQFQGMDILK